MDEQTVSSGNTTKVTQVKIPYNLALHASSLHLTRLRTYNSQEGAPIFSSNEDGCVLAIEAYHHLMLAQNVLQIYPLKCAANISKHKLVFLRFVETFGNKDFPQESIFKI